MDGGDGIFKVLEEKNIATIFDGNKTNVNAVYVSLQSMETPAIKSESETHLLPNGFYSYNKLTVVELVLYRTAEQKGSSNYNNNKNKIQKGVRCTIYTVGISYKLQIKSKNQGLQRRVES